MNKCEKRMKRKKNSDAHTNTHTYARTNTHALTHARTHALTHSHSLTLQFSDTQCNSLETMTRYLTVAVLSSGGMILPNVIAAACQRLDKFDAFHFSVVS